MHKTCRGEELKRFIEALIDYAEHNVTVHNRRTTVRGEAVSILRMACNPGKEARTIISVLDLVLQHRGYFEAEELKMEGPKNGIEHKVN